jgi:hypothetical protein
VNERSLELLLPHSCLTGCTLFSQEALAGRPEGLLCHIRSLYRINSTSVEHVYAPPTVGWHGEVGLKFNVMDFFNFLICYQKISEFLKTF